MKGQDSDSVFKRIGVRAQSDQLIIREDISSNVIFEEASGTKIRNLQVDEGATEFDDRDRADVVILTALNRPEHEQVLEIFGPDWEMIGRQGVVFYRTNLQTEGDPISIVTAVQTDMGLVPATILAAKATQSWQPNLLAMVGICAGVSEKVNIGDVVIGRHVFDYGSGKIESGVLQPDYEPVTMSDGLCGLAQDLARDRNALISIRESFPTAEGRPTTELKVHLGAIASGAAVVADDSIVKDIQSHKRSLYAIDMEAYGVARTAASSVSPTKHIIIKGVQDFANPDKNDQFREYSAFVSARVLKFFLQRYWSSVSTF